MIMFLPMSCLPHTLKFTSYFYSLSDIVDPLLLKEFLLRYRHPPFKSHHLAYTASCIAKLKHVPYDPKHSKYNLNLLSGMYTYAASETISLSCITFLTCSISEQLKEIGICWRMDH